MQTYRPAEMQTKQSTRTPTLISKPLTKQNHNVSRILYKPQRLLLGDQEPCTADQGCRIVSVGIVVLLSSLLLTCRAGVLTESQYYSSLNWTLNLGVLTRSYNRVNNMRAIRVLTPLYAHTCTQLSIRVSTLTSSLGPIYLPEEGMPE